MSYCKIIIQGNVGQDPDMRYTADGKPVANFSIAVSEKRGGDETTTWFRCTAFGKTAEIVSQYLHKGDSALIDGRIASRKFTDKAGAERESWEVTVDRLTLLGGKPKAEQPARPTGGGSMNSFDDMDDSQIPF
jgi:single-strand DNA-binding protein